MNTFFTKRVLLAFIFILQLSILKSATYYYVHNDLATNLNQFTKDQVNATNTGIGTAFWKHFSLVSGSTSTLNLLPGSTPILATDNIIFDNNSLPNRVVVTNYIISIDNPGAGLICNDFDARLWQPTALQLQTMAINIVTQIQCYRDFRLSPSDKFRYITGTSLTFPNNSPASVDSIHFYGTARLNGNTIRYSSILNININSNGKVFFCDTLNTTGHLTVRANDNIGTTHETHFLENIYKVNGRFTLNAGNLLFHKNVFFINDFRIGIEFTGTINSPGPITANVKLTTHAPGYYSSPGVWNPGLWSDPNSNITSITPYLYSSRNQNVMRLFNNMYIYRGVVDFSNTAFTDGAFYFTFGIRGSGLIGNIGINYISNINTYVHFSNRNTYSFYGPSSSAGVFQGFKLRGTYFFDNVNYVGTAYSANALSAVQAYFTRDTIVDTLLFRNNISTLYLPNGGALASTGRMTILPTGYAKFYSGYTYSFGMVYGGANLAQIYNEGKFIMGDTLTCSTGSMISKCFRLNLVMSATGTQTVGNTQIENSQFVGTPLQRTIHYSNTDMGGNNNLIFRMYAGQNTVNGVVPANANYAYGTAPYNSIPFTVSTPRTLLWNNTLNTTASYWTQNTWYNLADGDGLYNDCPPTYIDSVVVLPGSILRIDRRPTQCKSFNVLAGAITTLAQRAAPLAGASIDDSTTTLEVFGNFHLNQQMNNMLNRNIIFKAWQTYPTIRTSNTKFWRGLFFRGINTNSNVATGIETNPGSWTLLDDLNAYNQNTTFTPRSNSAPGCSIINFTAVTAAIPDEGSGFTGVSNNHWVNNYTIQFHAGNLYTNNRTISTYNFMMSPNGSTVKNLYLGSSTINIYGTTEFYMNAVFNNPQAYGSMFSVGDRSTRCFIYPGTSHIKMHCKAFFTIVANTLANNITTSSFQSKGQNFYDVSFLQNDTLDRVYRAGGNAIGTFTNGAGITRSGIYQSVNNNYHNITFWNNDPSYPQLSTWRDTINKVEFKRTTGSLNTGAIQTYTLGNGWAVPPLVGQTNSSIDSIIFNTKSNFLAAVGSPGNINIRKYLYFAPGSTNTFFPGARHRVYNNTSTTFSAAQGGEPWVDLTPSVPSWFPSYVAPPAKPAYIWAPWGAKVKSRTNCDNTTIIKFGGLLNAGNAIAYPTPYHWSGAAPRDTFDLDYVTIIDDSLTQFQTVNGNTLLQGSTLNWDAGPVASRTIVFRDGGTAIASWFDNTKWATLTFTASPNYTVIAGQQTAINYTVGLTGQCPPVCGDVVIFDNNSFTAPTNTIDLGGANSAYVGTIIWNQGVAGRLAGANTSVLNICNSLYFSTAMTNNFMGQTVFSAVDSNRVEFIQSGNKAFNNQILFNARNPSKYKTAWKLLDSLATMPVNGVIIPAMKISKGTLDTRGQKLYIVGGLDLNSTLQRGLILRNTKAYLTGGRGGYVSSGNGIAFNIEGNYTKLQFRADSSDINCYAVLAATPGNVSFPAHFYVWNGAGSSQFFTTNPRGFKFNKILMHSMVNGATNNALNFINLRSDTINSLTLFGKNSWNHFYKGYIKSLAAITPTNTPNQLPNIGNTNLVTAPLLRFNRGRIDTIRLDLRSPLGACPVNWDTMYVRDEFTLKPGSSLLMGQGGLTWFANRCNVQIVGTSALPVALNPGASFIGTTYNYPSGNRIQNEHYFRKDSGLVCTDYAQLYNIWAIGNGNGNNNCVGGASFGCSAGTPNSSAYGTWMSPIMSPTLGIRTLADTTLYSSETPNAPNSGRARFLAGNNADVGAPNPLVTHNCAGWDESPYSAFPTTSLTISQYSVCPGTPITASLSLIGSLTGKDFPITITYSVGGVLQPPVSYTSSTNSVFTFTLAPTVNTNITWIDMSNQRCFANVVTVNTTTTIVILPTPTVAITTNSSTICNGAISTLTASGAVSYTWSTSQTTNSISVTPTLTTSYSVVGTNSVGCNNPPSVITITVNTLPSLSISTQTNVNCFGGSTGAVTLTPSGGSGSGYTITPNTINNLSAGSYTYSVQDGVGCSSTIIPVSITQPTAALTAITSNTANTNCLTPTGMLAVSPNGGTSSYNYMWSPGGATTQTVTNLNGGTYTVVVTDNKNCTYTTTASLSNPISPIITATLSSATICSGSNITITPSGGTTYTIVPTIGTTTTTATSAVFSPTTNVAYDVYGTDATSCLSNTINLSVTVNTTPVVALSSVSSNTICSGNTSVINVSGANTYTLNPGALTGNSFTVSPITTTQYSITGMSSDLCPSSNTVNTIINVNPNPVVAISSVSSNTICSGNTSIINVSGANTYTLEPGTLTGTSFTVSPNTTIQYSITGTSSALCPSSNTVNTTINVNATPTVAISSVSSNTICNGNTTVINVSGANTYTLNPGGLTGNSFTVSPSATTQYSITGISALLCPASNTVNTTINVNPNPVVSVASVSSNTICSGNTSVINVSGANTYTLEPGTLTGSSFTVSPNTTTQYSITGTSSALCLSSNTVNTTINVNATPTVAISSVSSNTICSGNTSIINVNGANTYTLEPGTLTGNSFTVSPNTTTQYSITGMSSALCPSTNTVNTIINVNATPTLAIAMSNTAICNGESAILSASGANTYTWTNPSTISSSITVNPNSTTVYSLSGESALGCPASSQQYTLIVNPTPTVTVAGNSQICLGNSSLLLASGANSYVWTSGPATSGNTVTPSTQTQYTVTGINTIGNCTNTAVYTVSVSNTPTVGLSPSSIFICSGNTSTISSISNGGTNYTWTGPGIVSGNGTATIVVNAAGDYSVTASQTSGTLTCTTPTAAIASVTVGATPLSPLVSLTGPYCAPSAVTMSVSNVTGGLAYNWYNSSTGGTALQTNTTYTATSLAVGNYTYYAESQAGTCFSTIRTPVTFTVYAIPSTPTVSSIQYCQGTSASALVATGSNLIWATTSGTTSSAPTPSTNLSGVQTYSVSQTVNSCESPYSTITVTINPTASVSIPSISAICNGQTSVLTATVNGSTPSTYQWYSGGTLISGATTNIFNANVTGNYYVNVTTTPGNCSANSNTSSVNVSSNPTVALTTNTTVICENLGETTLDASQSLAGSGTITSYQWLYNSLSTGLNSTSYTTPSGQGGSYNVIVTNSFGCIDSADIAINITTYNCEIIIPEIFSPNGDGKNDTWVINALENYPNNTVQVFNRWGDEVYNQAPYKNDWNGSNFGAKSVLGKGELPSGTYYFILTLNDGDKKPITGYVQLVR